MRNYRKKYVSSLIDQINQINPFRKKGIGKDKNSNQGHKQMSFFNCTKKEHFKVLYINLDL